MTLDEKLKLKDQAIEKAMELTDDVDQQYWYQEGYCDSYEIGYKEGESSSKNLEIRNAIEKAWEFIEGHYFDSSKKPEDIKLAKYFFYNVMFKKLLNFKYGEVFAK